MYCSRFFRRPLCFVLLLAVLLSTGVDDAAAQVRRKPAQQAGGNVRNYSSRNFFIHTDLSEEDAKKLLDELEATLKLVAAYWGRRQKGRIECFLVRDLRNWSKDDLKEFSPAALSFVRVGAGITLTHRVRRGRRLTATSRIFAAAAVGTVKHEMVHAYCSLVYGSTGPVWFSEGLAEMGKFWTKDDPSVRCYPFVTRYLKQSNRKSISEILNGQQRTGDGWQNYAWRWAVCHLLSTNTNYAPRFRPLGIALMSGNKRVSYQSLYGSMQKEIDFEYRFFLDHFGSGYRVDLCSWNWKAKYKRPLAGASIGCKIEAARGWQPSKLKVKAGETYQFSVSGSWKLSKDGRSVTADGDSLGNGRLVGIVFNDYQLSEPFELGRYGTFKAPSDGELLLRCRDDWNDIADNAGTVSVQLKIDGDGKPLAKPGVEDF